MAYIQPTPVQVRHVLRSAGLSLAEGDIAFLGDGYEQWAFRAGDQVIRLPKEPDDAGAIEKLRREARVSRALAPMLPLPISDLDLHETPGGAFFSTHLIVPGVPLWQLKRPPAADFGAGLGRFLRVLHSQPVEEFAALGVDVLDGLRERQHRIQRYEQLARVTFPLISCEARGHVVQVFEATINDPAAFDFEPALTHFDIDARNLLASPETGQLTGVIDFGDVVIGNPAADYDAACAGMFRRLGIEDQISDLFREGGLPESAMTGRPQFSEVWWPLLDIEHGLEIGEQEFIAEGIRALNEVVPFGTKC